MTDLATQLQRADDRLARAREALEKAQAEWLRAQEARNTAHRLWWKEHRTSREFA